MPSFTSEYATNDLVEFKHDPKDLENSFGWIRGVSFRGFEDGTHVPTYSIHLVNREEVVNEVSEGEIIRRYTVDERKRV